MCIRDSVTTVYTIIIAAASFLEKDEGSKYDLDVSISAPLSYSLLLHTHFQNQK